jgi:hypothetical protein
VSRIRTTIASALGVLALSLAAAPIAQAQPLPGGSVELPPIEPIAVPIPMGSTAGQLPALPFPLFWQDPVPPPPPSPQFVASNWIVMYTACPAPGEWAYTENGTRAWCAQRKYTDAFHWAPSQEPFQHPEASDWSRMTRVANSLGGKRCDSEGSKTLNPSNGQEVYCDWEQRGPTPGLIWRFTDYLNFVTR